MPNELLPISQLIQLAKEQGLYLGKGKPENRLRYFIKIGLLPHMQRRKNPATGRVEGHLPLSVLPMLRKIQELKNQDYGPEAIKAWLVTDEIRQTQASQAPIQQFNGLVAKITAPLTSTLERMTQNQQAQDLEISRNLRELETRLPLPAEAPRGNQFFSRRLIAGIIALFFLSLISVFLISRTITEPLKQEIKNLALKLVTQPSTTNNYYQTTNNYNNQLPVDENGYLKLNGISIGDGNILLDSSGNIKFLGKVGGGLVDSETENLLLNPGFEVNQSGKPTFWDYALVASEGNTFVNQDLVARGLTHAGQNSTRFWFNIGSAMSLGLAQERTKLMAGKTYTLSAWVKGVNLTNGTVRLGFGTLRSSGATNFQDYHLTGYTAWQRITYTFIAPSANFFPFFEARSYSAGSLYLDDTALVEGTASTLFSTNSTSYLGNGSLTVLADASIYPTAGSDGQLGQDVNRFRSAFLVNLYANNIYGSETGTQGYWQRNSGTLSPTNITDDVLLGATATSSALIKLTGTSGNNSWINTGNVGIGTTGPGTALDVNGEVTVRSRSSSSSNVAAYFTSGGILSTVASSIRYKTNITSYEDVLDRLDHLRAVRFNWKENGEPDFGMVAEEVYNYFPDLVTYEDDGTTIRGLKYDKMAVLAIKGIQEQQAEINSLSTQLAGLNLSSTGDLQITPTNYVYDGHPEQNFQLLDAAGNLINRAAAFSQATIANLRVGAVSASRIITDTLQATQIDTEKIVSPLAEIETLNAKKVNVGIISPLADQSDVIIKLGTKGTNETSDSSGSSGFGRLLVQNEQGETVAGIDSGGNASFSGQVSVGNLSDLGNLDVSGDATVAGTLFADEIVTKHGKFGDLLAGQVNAGTVSATYITNVYNIPELSDGQNTQNASTSGSQSVRLSESPIASESPSLLTVWKGWPIFDTKDDLKITSDIKIIGHTSLASTTVAGDLTVDATVTINSQGLQTFNPTNILYLQPLGLGGVDILAGKITIDKDGNMNVEGNLTVKGSLTTAKLAVVDSLKSTGSAKFADLLVSKKLTISTASATLSSNASEQITDASIGQARILAGNQGITIKTPQVSGASQVFITATSPTENRVLYINSQTEGQFRVEIAEPVNQNINFNWWVVN